MHATTILAFICFLFCSVPLWAEIEMKVVKGEDRVVPADAEQVEMNGYLGERIKNNREGRLKKQVTEKALLEGFRNRPGKQEWVGEHVGKWLHAAVLAYENATHDKELLQKIQSIAQGLMECQLENGYLGTYLEKDYWTEWDVWVHKYDLIGLLSYYRITEDEKALDACEKIARLLIQTFGPDQRDLLKSGTHAGMAATSVLEPMSLLYQYTGKDEYLEFCRYIIARADEGPGLIRNIEKYKTVQRVGNKKAYEMMSNYIGLIEHWRATGEPRGLRAAELAWDSIADENVFITGSVDAHETFSEPHTLITQGHCTETCVQTTWVQLNLQLLRVSGDPKYAAMLHQHLYNHMLAAQHPDGLKWCYFTTMEGSKVTGNWVGFTTGIHCCSSSGARAIALIPTFAYMSANMNAHREASVLVNFYEDSTFQTKLNDTSVTLRQSTNYPWDGKVTLTVTAEQPVNFQLNLLIPRFAESLTISIDGQETSSPWTAGDYLTLSREWDDETTVLLEIDMPLTIHERDGRFALSRGPFVLAAEVGEDEPQDLKQVVPDLEWVKSHAQKQWDEYAMQIPYRYHGSGPESISEQRKLTFKPFAEASSNGELFSIWLPMLPKEEQIEE